MSDQRDATMTSAPVTEQFIITILNVADACDASIAQPVLDQKITLVAHKLTV